MARAMRTAASSGKGGTGEATVATNLAVTASGAAAALAR